MRTSITRAALALALAVPVTATFDGSSVGAASGAEPGDVRAQARTFAAGEYHTCAITPDGVSCWGDDAEGQLGNGPASTADVTQPRGPIPMPGGRTAVSLAAGSQHSCALLDTGAVSCWGFGEGGELGTGSDETRDTPSDPVTLPGSGRATAITAGANHTCALLDTGGVSCWGNNFFGQLGNGDQTGSDGLAPQPAVALPSGTSATAVAAGGSHTCALLDTQQIVCWGLNAVGQIGIGTSGGVLHDPAAPVELPAGAHAIGITAGAAHTCALLDDGDVACWGANSRGQLGVGDLDDRSTPTRVASLPGDGATQVVAGRQHTCARVSVSGKYACWGRNDLSQLGVGGTADRSTPTTSPDPVPSALALGAGFNHTCMLTTGSSGNRLQCWGSNADGQLGKPPGAITAFATPVVPAPADIIDVGLGTSFACALNDLGEVRCWGSDFTGGVGNGDVVGEPTTYGSPAPPVTFPGGRSAVKLTVGSFHACAVLDDDSVACWGRNDDGQIGNGTTGGDVTAPALVNGISAVDVTAGLSHTCARRIDGGASCWGRGDRLGDGVGANSPAPVDVAIPAGRTVSEIDAGSDHTCVVLDNQNLYCWGDNGSGQLGVGDQDDRAEPTFVLDQAPRVSAGSATTCVVRDGTGEATCWGSDQSGKLGNGAGFSIVTAPGPAISWDGGAGNFGAHDIQSDGSHTCALLGDLFTATGEAVCWGSNQFGRLGDGSDDTVVDRPRMPSIIAFPGGRDASRIVPGFSNTCAVFTDGTATCWGFASAILGQPFTTNDHVTTPPEPIDFGADEFIVSEAAGAPGLPAAPTGSPAQGAVDLTWAAPATDGGAPITGYRIDSRTDATNWAVAVADTGTATTLHTVTGLTEGVAYEFRVAAINSAGVSPPSLASAEVTPLPPPPPPPDIDPIEPARFVDTRPGEATFDGAAQGTGLLDDGAVIEFPIAGRGDVPDGVAAVALNVTSTSSVAPGFVTLFPCTPERPLASNLNYTAGQVVANSAIVRLSNAGTICAYAHTSTHVIIDVNGYLPQSSDLTTVNPTRYVETRVGQTEKTFDGVHEGEGPVAADTTVEFQIGGRGAVPSDATAVVINATVTQPDGPGFITLFPCTPERPLASNVNHKEGQTVANSAIVKLSSDGRLCAYALATTHLVIDVNGFLPAGSDVEPLDPQRFVETRVGPTELTFDGVHQGEGRITDAEIVSFQIAGRGGVPATAAAVLLNATATGSSVAGFVTLFPCTPERPLASNVNYAGGQTVANSAIVKLSDDGRLCAYAHTATDLIIDVNGYVE